MKRKSTEKMQQVRNLFSPIFQFLIKIKSVNRQISTFRTISDSNSFSNFFSERSLSNELHRLSGPHQCRPELAGQTEPCGSSPQIRNSDFAVDPRTGSRTGFPERLQKRLG
jgi:hypothetical protein